MESTQKPVAKTYIRSDGVEYVRVDYALKHQAGHGRDMIALVANFVRKMRPADFELYDAIMSLLHD